MPPPVNKNRSNPLAMHGAKNNDSIFLTVLQLSSLVHALLQVNMLCMTFDL